MPGDSRNPDPVRDPKPGELLNVTPEDRERLLTDHVRAMHMAENPREKENKELQAKAAEAGELSKTFSTVLSTPLEHATNAERLTVVPVLFGRPYRAAELSAGQHLIIAWGLGLHSRSIPPGAIVFVDEPERHLHPSAAILLLDKLMQAVGAQGQLWVATHSPSIAAHFGEETVYCVEQNRVRYAGTRLDQVLDGLLGGTQARLGLLDRLANAHSLNFARYAAQCLLPADVAPHRAADRQGVQFGTIVNEFAQRFGRVRILDYAAGRGRLAVALAEALPEPPRTSIDYFAYNAPAHDNFHEECLGNVSRLYGESATGHLCASLEAFVDEARVQLVVMCNFLHEVRPSEWREHFRAAHDALSDGGYLVIMEDQEPQMGELPTKDGFILLNLVELQLLFQDWKSICEFSIDERLTGFAVPKSLLTSVSDTHLVAALRAANKRAKLSILRLRSSTEGSPQLRGRRHALYALLVVSTSLAVDALTTANPADRIGEQ